MEKEKRLWPLEEYIFKHMEGTLSSCRNLSGGLKKSVSGEMSLPRRNITLKKLKLLEMKASIKQGKKYSVKVCELLLAHILPVLAVGTVKNVEDF